MTSKIPKIIHYCWFGGRPLPKTAQNYMETWKKHCPDYRIIEWNETNFDIHCCPYVEQAYAAGKYAFVADYARVFALKTMGGFYFDTDVELLRPLEFLRQYPAVSGFEEGNYLQTALIGSQPNGVWIQTMLDDYAERSFVAEDGGLDTTTNVATMTRLTVEKYGLQRENTEQDLGVCRIFPQEFFSPRSFSTGLLKTTANTVAIHHFDSTWTRSSDHKVRLHRYKIYRIFGEKIGKKALGFEEVFKKKGILGVVKRMLHVGRVSMGKPSALLYAHTGSRNHGCEALARTVSQAVRQAGAEAALLSSDPSQEKMYGLTEIAVYPWEHNLREFSPKWFLYKLSERIFHIRALERNLRRYKKNLRRVGDYTAAIAIGGDNYCYHQGRYYWEFDCDIKRQGNKLALIGCSVEPEDVKGELGEHLKVFDLITARESISYHAMRAAGIEQVRLIPDSAFLLEAEYLPLPPGFVEGNTIGINLSPLALQYSGDKETAYQAIEHLIQTILEKTDCQIAFISHVYKTTGGDREIADEILKRFSSPRIILIHDEAYNCMQIKGFIARCRLFIAARTHASIAAYSSQVPTLVLGYSVKSLGIATDLFGTYENYVIPIQSIDQKEALSEGFLWLVEHEAAIRGILADRIPGYCERCKALPDLLARFLGVNDED